MNHQIKEGDEPLPTTHSMEHKMSKSNSTPETVTSRKPRRVYPYKGHLLVCFAGQRYRSELPAEDSGISPEFEVIKVVAPDGEEAPASVEVTQRRKGKKGVTETWKLFQG